MVSRTLSAIPLAVFTVIVGAVSVRGVIVFTVIVFMAHTLVLHA
jgi:hypothetical protein